MGRWTQYDEDSSRLPEGMQRVGYDADTQQYTFKDSDGSLWTSAPGCEYGQLTRVRETGNSRIFFSEHGTDPEEAGTSADPWTFDHLPDDQYDVEKDVKASWRILAPFLLLVCLVPVLAFRFFRGPLSGGHPSITDCNIEGTEAIQIHQGDTCWDIAQKYSMTLDELEELNKEVTCKNLRIGEIICIRGRTLASDLGQT